MIDDSSEGFSATGLLSFFLSFLHTLHLSHMIKLQSRQNFHGLSIFMIIYYTINGNKKQQKMGKHDKI